MLVYFAINYVILQTSENLLNSNMQLRLIENRRKLKNKMKIIRFSPSFDKNKITLRKHLAELEENHNREISSTVFIAIKSFQMIYEPFPFHF